MRRGWGLFVWPATADNKGSKHLCQNTLGSLLFPGGCLTDGPDGLKRRSVT